MGKTNSKYSSGHFSLNFVISISVMAVFEKPCLPHNWREYLLIFLHGFGFVVRTPLPVIAVQYISGNTFNIVHSTSIVFLLASQYTLLSSIQPGNRNWIEVVGVIFVLLGSTFRSLLEFFDCNNRQICCKIS